MQNKWCRKLAWGREVNFLSVAPYPIPCREMTHKGLQSLYWDMLGTAWVRSPHLVIHRMCHIATSMGQGYLLPCPVPRFWRIGTLNPFCIHTKAYTLLTFVMPPLRMEGDNRMDHWIKVEKRTPGGPGYQRAENRHPVGGAIEHMIRSTYSIILLQFTYKTQIHG